MEDIKPRIIVRNAVIAAIPDHGDFTSREAGEKALAWLEEHEPEALEEWQRELALSQLREVASHILADRRAVARQVMRAEAVQKHAADLRAGENPLKQVYVVSMDNTRRAVGDMTADDLMFVAKSYTDQANRLGLEAAFFKQLAKRVGPGQTVKDVLDPEEFSRLYRSIIKEEDSNG